MLHIEPDSELDRKCQWHIVPAQLNPPERIENGLVKQYFVSSIKKDTQLTATFQGHALFGTTHEQPHLYKGLSYRDSENPSKVDIILTHRVGSITDWRKDAPWDGFEGHIGTLNKYVALQKAMHS